MNNKTLVGIIVAVLVIVGAIVLMKGQYQTNQTTTAPSVKPTAIETTSETGAPSEGTARKKELIVNVTANGFEPATVTVKSGAKVTWMNKSGSTANVSSAKHPTHLVYPPLNLGDFDDGKSVSLVFAKPGTYQYHNHLNPSQLGKVVVE